MIKIVNKNSRLILIVIVFCSILFAIYISFDYFSNSDRSFRSRSSAEQLTTLNISSLTNESSVNQNNQTTFFNLRTNINNSIYDNPINNSADIAAFIQNKPRYNGVLDIESPNRSDLVLISESPSNLELIRTIQEDPKSKSIQIAQTKTPQSHYIYTQTRCEGVSIYSSNISFHVGESNNLYAMSGNITNDTDVDCAKNITQEQAVENARKQALASFEDKTSLTVEYVNMYVFDPKLVDNTAAGKSQLAYHVIACSQSYCKSYFVSAVDGSILFENILFQTGLNRQICQYSSCRREGGSASSNQNINQLYDMFGETYNYFFSTFNRDSLNGSGMLIKAYVKPGMNNAGWSGMFNQFEFDPIFIANDIVAHEFTHGVSQYAVGGQGLRYMHDSGALNEGYSDMFGSAVDPNDWLMGEDSTFAKSRGGALRDMANPPRFNDPDKYSSPLFYCTRSTADSAQSRVVHQNSGVYNKMLFLMVDGGSFNGCTITPVGRERAMAMLYRALTVYLVGKNTANGRELYDQILAACNDLYDAGTCSNAASAMQAVELDQQQRGRDWGPFCTAGSTRPLITPSPATCIGAPTGSVPTTGTSLTPEPTVSSMPTGQIPTQEPINTQTPQYVEYRGTFSSLLPGIVIQGTIETKYDGQLFTLTASVNDIPSYSPDLYTYEGRLFGKDIIDTGEFAKEGSKFINRYSVGKDLTSYTTYQVIQKDKATDVSIPLFLGSLEGVGQPGQPTPIPSQEEVIINLKLKFQGINKKPSSGIDRMLVRIGINSSDMDSTIYSAGQFEVDNQGIWHGSVSFDPTLLKLDGSQSGHNRIYVKGPRHSQKKVGDEKPQEQEAGTYVSTKDAIGLKKGENNFDFSGVVMLAGDLNQDGIINSVDIAFIYNNINISDPIVLAFGDINMDGVINTTDYGQAISSLLTRVDRY